MSAAVTPVAALLVRHHTHTHTQLSFPGSETQLGIYTCVHTLIQLLVTCLAILTDVAWRWSLCSEREREKKKEGGGGSKSLAAYANTYFTCVIAKERFEVDKQKQFTPTLGVYQKHSVSGRMECVGACACCWR